MSLPTPRQLLTSLVNAIAAVPLAPAAAAAAGEGRNPLGRVPASHRPLLTTLHVLFPALLLPALDLLDRGLVARAVLAPAAGRGGGGGGGPPGEQGGGGGGSTDAAAMAEPAPAVYVVRSAAPQSHRGRHGDRPAPAGGRQAYVVHVGAWNCTCAAFAFSAFPGGRGRARRPPPTPGQAEAETETGAGAGAGAGWEFGGLSADGTAGAGAGAGAEEEGVPCCKHLLACVLAERWGALRGYVAERTVGREEMAGIVADI